ncbi:MAG: C1 family peptidase [Parabacteroides merdae]
MVETYSSDNTSRMSNLIGLKLKEYGLELRDAKGSKPEALAKRKTEMLGEIYRMLVLNLRRTSYEIHLDTQRRKRQTGRDKRIHPAIILSGIRGRRFEEQLCHADERSEPRLL